MKRTFPFLLAPILCAFVVGCGSSEPEPTLKAVEPPDTPVKKSEVPKDNRHKGSSGGINKNPGAPS